MLNTINLNTFNRHLIFLHLFNLIFLVNAENDRLLTGLRSLRNKAAQDISNEQVNNVQMRPGDSMNFNQNDDSKSEIPTSSANLINKNSTIKEYLYQGDILLNDAQLDIMLSDQGLIHDQSRRRKRQGSNSGIARWTNGVFYSYAGSADDIMKQAFQMAVKFWSDHTCINFYENDSIRDRIEVFKGSGCYSYVGKLGGVQELSLGNGCADRAIASHELGHALGFFHTHSRWDRDDYITVNAKNLDPNYADQYLKESKEINDNFGLPYDYGSIMHYDCTSSSVDGKKITMTAKNDEYQVAMGSPVVSFYDVLMMNIMYSCLDKCDSYSSAKCLNGGYPSPRNCSKCVCPGAYSGPNCERLPNICGRNLTAEPDWQRFNVSLRSNMLKDLKPTDYLLPLMECDYWITSPENTTIEIIVRALDIVADTYGCTFGAVEIKIGPDQNYTGIRICMKQYGVNVVYRSIYNFMGIRVYNTIVKTKASISYRYVSSNSTDPENDVPILVSTDLPLAPASTTQSNHFNSVNENEPTTRTRTFISAEECSDLLPNCVAAGQLGYCSNRETFLYCKKTCGCQNQ